jgi:hypothetical protein
VESVIPLLKPPGSNTFSPAFASTEQVNGSLA